MTSPSVTASVPGRADFIGLLRTIASGAVGTDDLSIDFVQDLGLAVDEAAAELLSVGATSIELQIEPGEHGIQVVISGDGAAGPWPTRGWERSMGGVVLSALVRDIELTSTGDRRSVRFLI